jgi:hypothetical protein
MEKVKTAEARMPGGTMGKEMASENCIHFWDSARLNAQET